MVIINDLEIKKVKDFINYITNVEEIDYDNIKVIDDKLYDLLTVKLPNNNLNDLISFIKLFRTSKKYNIVNHIIYKYYEKIKNIDQSVEKYIKYIEYKKINKADCKSDKYYKLLFGDKWKEYKDLEIKRRSGRIYKKI
jgi:hypothetical protein